MAVPPSLPLARSTTEGFCALRFHQLSSCMLAHDPSAAVGCPCCSLRACRERALTSPCSCCGHGAWWGTGGPQPQYLILRRAGGPRGDPLLPVWEHSSWPCQGLGLSRYNTAMRSPPTNPPAGQLRALPARPRFRHGCSKAGPNQALHRTAARHTALEAATAACSRGTASLQSRVVGRGTRVSRGFLLLLPPQRRC